MTVQLVNLKKYYVKKIRNLTKNDKKDINKDVVPGLKMTERLVQIYTLLRKNGIYRILFIYGCFFQLLFVIG